MPAGFCLRASSCQPNVNRSEPINPAGVTAALLYVLICTSAVLHAQNTAQPTTRHKCRLHAACAIHVPAHIAEVAGQLGLRCWAGLTHAPHRQVRKLTKGHACQCMSCICRFRPWSTHQPVNKHSQWAIRHAAAQQAATAATTTLPCSCERGRAQHIIHMPRPASKSLPVSACDVHAQTPATYA